MKTQLTALLAMFFVVNVFAMNWEARKTAMQKVVMDKSKKQGQPGLLTKVIICLEDSIIKKYANNRKQSAVGNENTIKLEKFTLNVPFNSPDNKKQILVRADKTISLSLQKEDASNEFVKAKNLVLPDGFASINSVVFSPDSTKVVVAGQRSYDYQRDGNIVVYNIRDVEPGPESVAKQILNRDSFNTDSIEFISNSKGMQFVSKGKNLKVRSESFIWTLLTDKEAELLDQLQSYSEAQLKFINDLCSLASQGRSIALKRGTEDWEIFMSFSEDMRSLLTDVFSIGSGWFSWFTSWFK